MSLHGIDLPTSFQASSAPDQCSNACTSVVQQSLTAATGSIASSKDGVVYSSFSSHMHQMQALSSMLDAQQRAHIQTVTSKTTVSVLQFTCSVFEGWERVYIHVKRKRNVKTEWKEYTPNLAW